MFVLPFVEYFTILTTCDLIDISAVCAVPGDTEDDRAGRLLYESFTAVVILRDQVRVTDPDWLDFLRHLRYGRVQESHIEMLRKLVISHSNCLPTDFLVPPWKDAILITPRHAVRERWNDAAARQHCQQAQVQLFVCRAEDRTRTRLLGPEERAAVAQYLRKQRRTKRKHLDIADGSRGEVVKIVLRMFLYDLTEHVCRNFPD
ncbi:hypothetical protein NEOLEDRAFT_1141701 [Neolentinus lepideus HHB14362 ss-1]|uniref:Uncharacterized protein n=1 Tax=Neolentinus lepideus HHB14362 ss-1 TaxID=1314782 RepID=A0A165NIT2_9AGAM|nr:hypothetical protein NEOLEDRAFT_1141701 [Neolentinus lepideus HHB14362 ss-1]